MEVPLHHVDVPAAPDVPAGRRDARLVLVHGFTQTHRAWDPFLAALAGRAPARAVDLPGHGASAGVRLDFPSTAAALAEVGGRSVYVGYSLGGRLCLRLAVERPDLVAGLVLVGASPGLADAAERAERRQADDDLADDLERDGTTAFLDRWLAQPLFASLSPEAAQLDVRRANPAAGLASSLRLCGTGVQEPLWDRLAHVRATTLLVVGERDAKFADLARRMAAPMPDAKVVVVPGSGHSVPLEQPAALADVVAGALDVLRRARAPR